MTGAAVAGGKREQTKAHNRAAILAAAREVFAELGYDAAGVRDVIRRTELASGTRRAGGSGRGGLPLVIRRNLAAFPGVSQLA